MLELVVIWIAVLVVAAIFCGVAFVVSATPQERLMRERRRHAERTARTARRMTQIRQRTIRRMDRAERRWRP